MTTPVQLVTAILVGAAGLALWVDVRLGERGPRSITMVVLHAAGAFFAVRAMAVVAPMAIHKGSALLTMVALFGLVLPGWIYAFLASLWTMKLLRGVRPR
ncbi:MAG: hypothetical protein C5B48_10435 [Candidatus Rokuibacteriota bacterium]|nr:MAG: hypothetical protein C5B48_10435 [Candidatus Rokubacteria bacterium]